MPTITSADSTSKGRHRLKREREMSPPSMHSNASFDNSPRHATKRDSRMSRNERGRRSSSFSCSRRQDVDRTSTRRRQDIDVTDDWRQLHFKPHRETTYAENQTFARNYRRKSERRYATLCYAARRYAAQLYASLQTPGPSDSIKVNQGQSATTPPRRRRVPQNDATRRCATLRDAAFDFLLHRRPSPSFSFSTEPPIETTMSHRRRLPLSWWFFSSSMERPRASRLIIVFFECLDDDDGDDDDGNDSDYRVRRSEGPSETVSLHITNSFRTPLREWTTTTARRRERCGNFSTPN